MESQTFDNLDSTVEFSHILSQTGIFFKNKVNYINEPLEPSTFCGPILGVGVLEGTLGDYRSASPTLLNKSSSWGYTQSLANFLQNYKKIQVSAVQGFDMLKFEDFGTRTVEIFANPQQKLITKM